MITLSETKNENGKFSPLLSKEGPGVVKESFLDLLSASRGISFNHNADRPACHQSGRSGGCLFSVVLTQEG
jgi:hypothetical protein